MMAFGAGQGAASVPTGSAGPGWGDSNTRVITVLVLGGGLLFANWILTPNGFGFVGSWLSTQPQIPSAIGARGNSTWGELALGGGFLGVLLILAAVSEDAGSLATAILVAIWVAWLLGNGNTVLSFGGAKEAQPSSTAKAETPPKVS